MASLSSVLAQIRQNESSGNYTAQNPTSSASGAYQFVNGTWQSLTQKSGIGTEYATAGSAPANVQDAVAAYALEQNPNANSCSLWGTCDAAGNVTGPARYPTVDTYDTSSQQLALSGSGGLLGNTGDPSGQGYGSNGVTTTSADGSAVIDPTTGEPIGGGSQLGTGVGGASGTGGYTSSGTAIQPGAASAAQLNLGLQSSVTNWVNGVMNSIKNYLSGAWDAGINLAGRAGILIVALLLIFVALWRLLDPSGEKTQAVVRSASEAA